jgi:eukaryotic-like serine/threonine-protein kinase
MHDDRTRVMGQPGGPGDRPHGNMRLLVAGLVAVIVGLLIAIVVIAGDGDGETTSLPTEATTLPTATEETTEPTETTETTETTEPTATTTSPTTTTETTTEEEDESGGIEAP